MGHGWRAGRLFLQLLWGMLLSGLFFSGSSQAKELVGRLGLGYNAQFNQTTLTDGIPGVSVKYGFAPRSMIEIIGGFSSEKQGPSVAAFKYMYTLHPENYANFYFLAGGGLISAHGKNGSEFLGGFGAEFFIPGVDSVGINFETGMAMENLTSDSFVLKTFGVSFINAGMHFYL